MQICALAREIPGGTTMEPTGATSPAAYRLRSSPTAPAARSGIDAEIFDLQGTVITPRGANP